MIYRHRHPHPASASLLLPSDSYLPLGFLTSCRRDPLFSRLPPRMHGRVQYVWSTIPLVVKLIEQSSGLAPILVIRSTVPPGTTLKWEAEVRAKTDKPFQVRGTPVRCCFVFYPSRVRTAAAPTFGDKILGIDWDMFQDVFYSALCIYTSIVFLYFDVRSDICMIFNIDISIY